MYTTYSKKNILQVKKKQILNTNPNANTTIHVLLQ